MSGPAPVTSDTEVCGQASSAQLLLLTTVCLVGLGMRLAGLGVWEFAYDEYFTVFEADKRYLSWINPAYYALTTLSFSVFGFNEWAARLPALVLAMLSLPVFYFCWSRVVGAAAALTGVLLITVSTWHLWYSQFARFYSGVFLLGTVTYYAYYRALRDDNLAWLFWFFLCAAVGTLFHLTFVLAVFACGVFSLAVLASKTLKAVHSARAARWHLGICVLCGVLVLPLIVNVWGDWQGSDQFWGYGLLGTALQLAKWLQIPIGAAALLGLVLMLRRPHLGLFFLIATGVPIGTLLLASTITDVRNEYVFFCVPLIFVLAGYLCAEVSRWMPRPAHDNRLGRAGGAIVAQAALIIVLASTLPELVSYYTGRATLHIRDTVEQTRLGFRPGDRVLPLVNLYNFFHHYADGELPREPTLGDPLDDRVIWPEKLRPYAATPGCVWIIVPVRRQALAKPLEAWLFTHASLAWRTQSQRFDYKVEGYELFVAGAEQKQCVARIVAPPSEP